MERKRDGEENERNKDLTELSLTLKQAFQSWLPQRVPSAIRLTLAPPGGRRQQREETRERIKYRISVSCVFTADEEERAHSTMSADENQEPYYIIPGPPAPPAPPGGGATGLPGGGLPYYNIPGQQVAEYSSRRDHDPAVRSEEVLGRSPGMTTCSSCRQRVLTHVSFRVGRFAKMLCALFVILGSLQAPKDPNRLLQAPKDPNRLLQTPIDPNRLLQAPVDPNRLLQILTGPYRLL
ncbi:hypothetical protein EYF80_038826 [Liparis tanakae]|uniref:LITAF domain-containing protein n=1 Tax=Liparis tanakae TaxID=230148 RepID=A0A4Z2GDG8_9TELE|nr:hypothetical protein EYF80_038826 [Liparis tanakae]